MIITRTVTSPRPVATDTAQVLRGRRYLIVASWSFLLLIALMVSGILAVLVTTGEMPTEEPVTADILVPLRPLRIAVAWALLLPIGLAAVGSALIARGLAGPRMSRALCDAIWLVTCVATVVYAVTWTVGYFFTTPSILDDPAYAFSSLWVRHVVFPLLLGASAVLAWVVSLAGIARVTMRWLAIGALVVAAVFAATGAEFLPPAVVVAVWIPVAVSLRRALRHEAAASAAV